MGGNVVNVIGLESTQRVLKAIDPQLVKAMDREIRGAVNKIRTTSRSLAPARTGALRRGIVTRKGNARGRSSVAWQVRSNTKQGGILEFAAQGHTKRGRALVATLNERYGAPGRFVWEAWDRDKSAVYTSMKATILTAEDVIQRRLDGVR